MNRKADSFFIRPQRENPFSLRKKKRINLLALGDVGGMLLIGLRLLGTEAVSSIGICDLNEKSILRFEMEAGQIQAPFARERMPRVEIISPERLFDCDIFVFCASKGVPPVGSRVEDVRNGPAEGQFSAGGSFCGEGGIQGFSGTVCRGFRPGRSAV